MLVVAVLPDAGRAAPGDVPVRQLDVLEPALRLAAALRAEVLAVAVPAGPERPDEALRQALATGADRVLAVRTGPDRAGDRARADALCAVLDARGERPDLVLYSTDDDGPAGFVAARRAAAQALGLLRLEPGSGPGDAELHGLRRLDGARRERLAIPLPAVCSVLGGTPPPRAGLAAVLAAGGAGIPQAATSAAGHFAVRSGPSRPLRPRPRPAPAPSGDHRERLLALTGALRPQAPARLVTPGDPAAAAEELHSFLRAHGYLPGEGW